MVLLTITVHTTGTGSKTVESEHTTVSFLFRAFYGKSFVETLIFLQQLQSQTDHASTNLVFTKTVHHAQQATSSAKREFQINCHAKRDQFMMTEFMAATGPIFYQKSAIQKLSLDSSVQLRLIHDHRLLDSGHHRDSQVSFNRINWFEFWEGVNSFFSNPHLLPFR